METNRYLERNQTLDSRMTAPSISQPGTFANVGRTPISGICPTRSVIPPLENGDRLTRDEFELRYNAMPEANKIELIEGEVYMPSPVRFAAHAAPHGELVSLLAIYHAWTPGTKAGNNATVRLDLDNEPQPDVVLLIDVKGVGQAKIDADDFVSGAPELIAEVASSSVSIELGKKLHAYRRNGVREYLVWRVLDREFDFFILKGGAFEPAGADAKGVLHSTVFPGLWIDVPSLIQGNLRAAHETLQEGLKSAEHAAFLSRLAQSS